jgi:hypothetical protein
MASRKKNTVWTTYQQIFTFIVLSAVLNTTSDASLYLSIRENSRVLGGLSLNRNDVVKYDPATNSASMFLSGARFATANADVDAFDMLPNGNLLLSTTSVATLGGLSFRAGDIVEYNPIADSASLFFSQDLITRTNGRAVSSNVDVVSRLPNGNLLLSISDSANRQLGGVTFTDDDVLEYNPVTNTASLVFDGSSLLQVASGDLDIDAFHVLANGDVLFSTIVDSSLGLFSFRDGDLVQFHGSSGTASVFFSESHFSRNTDIDAAMLAEDVVIDPNPEPSALMTWGVLALVGFAYFSVKRRRSMSNE